MKWKSVISIQKEYTRNNLNNNFTQCNYKMWHLDSNDFKQMYYSQTSSTFFCWRSLLVSFWSVKMYISVFYVAVRCCKVSVYRLTNPSTSYRLTFVFPAIAIFLFVFLFFFDQKFVISCTWATTSPLTSSLSRAFERFPALFNTPCIHCM